MKIEYNIDFNSILKEVQKEKLRYWVNKEVAPEIADASSKFIKAGKVRPKLKKTNPRGVKAPPLFDTGKLADSLKGGPKGISGVNYAKEHRREGGYPWEEKGIIVEQREFITAALPSEKGNTNKIYKDFEEKFTKLLENRMRK